MGKEALLDEAVPTRSLSGYWVDDNGKPILGYFGDSDNQTNAHSVPVYPFLFLSCCIFRLFSDFGAIG
jgi:hypothetical protein